MDVETAKQTGRAANCTWEDGEVVETFRQPFDILSEMATTAARIEAGERAKSAKSEIWLPELDSNQRQFD